MLAHQHVFSLWLLLLLHDSGSAMKWNLLRRDRDRVAQEGDVRLFGGGVSEGRVEIYHEEKWGTVCDDGWDLAEAQVVCRQLHFPGAKAVVVGKDYGKASGPIWLDDLKCEGTEDYLSTCAFRNWGTTDCSHKEDIGVICETSRFVVPGSNVTESDSTYSLDHSISLSDELGQIFDSERGCDFNILVQTRTGNRGEEGAPEVVGTTICAHKLILSQFPLFNASEGNDSITVDISQSCKPFFTPFIRYIYTRKLDVTFSSVQCFHWMAYTFGVKQLMEDAGRLFFKILPEDPLFHTQLSLCEYAEETGDTVLKETGEQYLAWNFQKLTTSPAWSHISAELLGSLLMRSDLVVPDEYFVLQTVESWITERGNSTSPETQLDLLSQVRFPMIPAEVLYNLDYNSSPFKIHETVYRENILKAFQFNVLLFSNLLSNPKFDRKDYDYQPRIYTANPWSVAIPAQRSYNEATKWLTTPVHNSLIFKSNQIRWEANFFKSQYECSNRGVRCGSYPTARLVPQTSRSEWRNIVFHNRLLQKCQGKYISHIQDFKNDVAVPATQATAYPCPDDQYTYYFVVIPKYV